MIFHHIRAAAAEFTPRLRRGSFSCPCGLEELFDTGLYAQSIGAKAGCLYSSSWRLTTKIIPRSKGLQRNNRAIWRPLFPDDLNQYTFVPAAVELAVEDLLPGPEIQFPFRHGNNNLAAHNGPFQMGVPVIFAA